MTEDERKNRNPKPEQLTVKLADAPELFIKDLELNRVYILAQTQAATFNFIGAPDFLGQKVYTFAAPRVADSSGRPLTLYRLRARPDGSGCLEDGRGVKVTIRQYNGPDQ